MMSVRSLALAGALVSCPLAAAQSPLPAFELPTVIDGLPFEFFQPRVVDISGDGIPDLVGAARVEGGPFQLVAAIASAPLEFGPAEVASQLVGLEGPPVAADLDQDGLTDLIVRVAQPTRRIAVLRGTGQGAAPFGPVEVGPSTPITAFPTLRLADRDGDGDLDLFLLRNGEVEVLQIDGTTPAAGFGTTGIAVDESYAVADLDGDGLAEVIGIAGNELRLWPLGPGATPSVIDTALLPADIIQVRDVDLDGNQDIVLTDQNGLRTYLGDGALGFTSATLVVGNDPRFVRFADVDGDGLDDLLYVESVPFPGISTFLWARNTGTLPYPAGQEFPGIESLGRPVDVNSDGLVDFVFGTSYRLNLGGSVIGPVETFETQEPEPVIDIAVLNADRDIRVDDLLLLSESGTEIRRVLGQPDGELQMPGELLIDLAGQVLDVQSLGGNRFITLENVGSETRVRRYTLQLGAAVFSNEARIVPLAPGARVVDLVMAPGFGLTSSEVELLVDTPSGLLHVRALGGFGSSANDPGETTALGLSSAEGRLADVDADGRLDVVSATGQTVLIHRRRASGGFFPPLSVAIGAPVTGLEVADMDGDGTLDLVTQGNLSTRVQRGLGALIYGPPVFLFSSGQSEARTVTAQDLNDDGRVDLVVSPFNSVIGQGAVALIGDGALGVSEFSLVLDKQLLDGRPQFADVDADGDIDLIGLSLDGRAVVSRSRLNAAIGTGFCANQVPNSRGEFGMLQAFGDDSIAADRLILRADSLPPLVTTLLLGSPAVPTSGVPLANSAGVLCLAGPIGRFLAPGQVGSTLPDGARLVEVTVGALASPMGPVPAVAGESWSFQMWHRDTVGGVPTSNLTRGIQVRFTD